MPTDAALLAEVPLFALLDEDERAILAAQVEAVTFEAGKTLFKTGDPGDSLYVIRSGEVEIYVKDNTGARIVLETASAGDFFGDISLLDGGARTASVVVTKEMQALRVDRGDLDQLLRAHPDAALGLLAAMGRRLRQSGELLRHTVSRNVNEEVDDTRTGVQKAADWIAEFSGSITFLNIHIVLFALWILLNTEWVKVIPGIGAITMFDPFPFGLLTMSVSLEAIVLSVFVLLSQNRQAAKEKVRADIEYDVNLKAELEVAHLHEKFDDLNAKLQERLVQIEKALQKR